MATKKKKKKVVDKLGPKEIPKPITIDLEELYTYKLKVLSRAVDDAKANIVNPLKQAYEQDLIQRINTVVAADPVCQKAAAARAECINEVLDLVSSQLPEGYAVTNIKPEESTITAEFLPDNVNKRV